MSNRVLVPALKARVGEWNYYICVMKYAQVAKEIEFAHDLGGNAELGELIQRGITERTKGITEYLLKSEHRFLGAMIVAAWGGDPQYLSVDMSDADGLLKGLDSSFGVLTFDNSVRYFALDGQHRLKAIKDAIKIDPSLSSEEISVILVSHYNTDDGRKRTRRLFTNINKNAKKTTAGEDIALDEDDGFAVITRRIIDEDENFKKSGSVMVFTKNNTSGEIKIAPANVPAGHKSAITTIVTIYNMIKELDFGLDSSMVKSKEKDGLRPPEDILDSSYEILRKRLGQLFVNCGNVFSLVNEKGVKEVRVPTGDVAASHPMLRAVIQRAIASVAGTIIKQQKINWDTLLERLNELDWKMSSAPWISVSSLEDGRLKMKTSRDYVELLKSLLIVHLAPNSKNEIQRARKDFKTLLNYNYPISEDELSKNILFKL